MGKIILILIFTMIALGCNKKQSKKDHNDISKIEYIPVIKKENFLIKINNVLISNYLIRKEIIIKPEKSQFFLVKTIVFTKNANSKKIEEF